MSFKNNEGLSLDLLPPKVDLETKVILKQVNRANRALAELKGYAELIPNKNILINAIVLNEAKDSSEIENIVTTHDEIYKAMTSASSANNAAKEVLNYRSAVWRGYELTNQNNMLTTNMVIEIQSVIEKNKAGIRKLPGTNLINEKTGEVIYTPPSGEENLRTLMKNLEAYINEDYDNVDPLIKLAVIHFQFESIHPFYDGNGRTGRIINVLYLVLKGLLDEPILYLSRYIIKNKQAYYRLLQEVRTKNNWEEWILYILEAIEATSEETLKLVKNIKKLMDETIDEVSTKLPKIYSRELVEQLFAEVYTKTNYIENKLDVTRKTAAGYLKEIEGIGILESSKVGKEIIYLNKPLYELLSKHE